ncbi:hypothetical protein V5P93_002300 [Actinokineospora auranticolor]|uniref:Uncharacterized protein n=1 Tax=Actinokineospora auranticolor TaxID=155976 RepID=A0A2S6GDM8_9PSEU|nr:hypothetical protein [Actinokineospora auranticolor]PPK63329.1 hypothetical protein CLV40_12942 [Actinokineospora auranticolor]
MAGNKQGWQPLLERLRSGPMFEKWHWLQWNFSPHHAHEPPFAQVTLEALLTCDRMMSGFADDMLGRLERIGGRHKNLDDYEQIKQWLGELLVVHHFVSYPWPVPVTFDHEPVADGSKQNPEMTVNASGFRLGIEVKTPDLRSLSEGRETADWQLLDRMPGMKEALSGEMILPRDNPVKDFLRSADNKFAGFRVADPNFRSVLVIVWDDFVNEPISALLSPSSGLLTSNSFDKLPDGKRRTYPNVDAVVLLRHQHQFVEGMANRPPLDQRDDFIDYGQPDNFPFNCLIVCPDGKTLNEELKKALSATPPHQGLGAEYIPAEIVMWI